MEINSQMDITADHQPGKEEKPSARILVVDDDTLNQRMMQVLLTREGHQVDVVSSGLEAIEAIKLQRYDIVFMDLQMPVMDGVETSRRIREWENGGPHTFIVALTASYLPEQGQELFEVGIDNYVSKPFEVEHIQRLLKYSLNSKAPVKDLPVAVEQKPAPDAVLDVPSGLKQVGGDLQTYRELLGEFIQELPGRLQAIQNSLVQQDLDGLARAAHNMNGIAANLGASRLSRYAHWLDTESVEGYTEALDHLVGELQLTATQLIETSNDFLAEGGPIAQVTEKYCSLLEE
jgi:CheY-like chemotaxis protein/HPt (histidine-containing phosphotransfer) domain-containing protein